MTGKRVVVAVVCTVLVLFIGSMAVMGWQSHQPVEVGLAHQRLRDCPNTPNCVSSDAPPGSHFVPPLAEPAGAGPPLEQAKAVLETMPRTRVVTMTENYLHAESESLIFRFVDDLELHHRPESGTIAVRSASRVGHGDLGVNRRRVERLRAALEKR